MAGRAERTDPKLWDAVKREVTEGDKGGDPGQWSARKAQMAVQEYKRRGGGYAGRKSGDNHLTQWTQEEWGTKSGRRSRDSGERYLPKEAREHLSDAEYKRTSDAKRRDRAKGRQFSAQPRDVAQKTARHRHPAEPSKAALMAEAKRRDVPGRSRMDKAALLRALRH
jgi:hypothetical protein